MFGSPCFLNCYGVKARNSAIVTGTAPGRVPIDSRCRLPWHPDRNYYFESMITSPRGNCKEKFALAAYCTANHENAKELLKDFKDAMP